MSDAWQEIQAVKSKRNSLREKLQKRKIERQVILNETSDKIVPSKWYLHRYVNHSVLVIYNNYIYRGIFIAEYE